MPYHTTAGGGGGARRFNWLAIVADPEVRSIRDLRGAHLPMLERMYRQCVQAIQREYRVGWEDVMVFANYPPSVYKLHFHFCAPFFQPTAYDAFRMHSLSAIINNLQVNPEYYALSTFQIPVHTNSDLYRAVVAARGECGGVSPSSSASTPTASSSAGSDEEPP
jgi:m7GpppX diphosphatase